MLGIFTLGLGSVITPAFSTIFFFANFSTGQAAEIFWDISLQLILLLAGILLLIGSVMLIRGVESRGLRISYITLLVYLTIINLFLFYYYQFAIILAAVFQFALLLGVLHYQRRYINPPAVKH